MSDGNVIGGSRPGGTLNLPGVNGPRNPITNGIRTGSFNMPSGGAAGPVIPNAVLTDRTGQLSPRALNSLARDPARTQLPVASRESTIGVLYGGPERIGGQIYVIGTFGGKLYMAQIYCQGEIERIGTNAANDMTGIFVNDALAPSGVAVHKYLGPASQAAGAVDSWLAAAFSLPAFDEKLPDTAYAVYEVSAGAVSRFPRIAAEVKGLKVFDPRCNLFPYSNAFSAWTDIGSPAALQNAVGPVGARNYAWTLTDSNAAAADGKVLGIAIGNDSNSYTMSVKVAKTTGGTSKTCQIDLSVQGGSPVTGSVMLNTDTGAWSGGSGVSVVDLGTFWQVTHSVANNASGNVVLYVALYPAVAANGSFVFSAAETGSAIFTEVSVRHAARPAGYLETDAAGLDQPTRWSDNPALCLGDFLASSTYGEGRNVDAQSLATAAEYCDQMMGMVPVNATYTWAANFVTVNSPAHGLTAGQNVQVDFTSGAAGPDSSYAVFAAATDTYTFALTGAGAGGNLTWFTTASNERRSRIGLLIDNVQPVRAWRDLLRAYVPCWVNFDGNTAYLRVDGPSATDHVFTAANIDATAGMPTMQRAGVQDTPSIVSIAYTDTSATPWRLQTVEADSGASAVRRTRIDMPGIHSRGQARRVAIEKLNHYRLEDLTGEISVYEEGIKIFPGDRARITDDIGITALEVRILTVRDLGHGRWRLRWRKYDPRVYSGAVEAP